MYLLTLGLTKTEIYKLAKKKDHAWTSARKMLTKAYTNIGASKHVNASHAGDDCPVT